MATTLSESTSALVSSFSSILVSEIGDKTFFIAAIMAMRYSRLVAFAGSYSALFCQTGLSCIFGLLFVQFVSKLYTEAIACLLFFFFGSKLIFDSLSGKQEGNELQEVEEEMEKVHKQMVQDNKKSKQLQKKDQHNINPQLLVIFWQAFTLTFIAEWGDRSQLTTIALSASEDAPQVFIGAASAHFLCTFASVMGGKIIATKISEKMINLIGGTLFMIFGIKTAIEVNHLYFESV